MISDLVLRIYADLLAGLDKEPAILDHKYMDQNAMNTMDPKLREAYERVMGATAVPRPPAPAQPIAPPAPVAPAQPVPPQPPMQSQAFTPPPVQQAAPPPPMQQAAPPPPPPAYNRSATLASLDTTPATEMHAYVADEVAGAKQNIKTIQMIYIGGGIIFFAVYALFWMKFFEVASPF